MGGALQSGSGDEPLSEAEPTLSNAECGMTNDKGEAPETPSAVIVDTPEVIEAPPAQSGTPNAKPKPPTKKAVTKAKK